MLQMLSYLNCLRKSRKGQGMVEYGLILGGVVVIVLAVMAAMQSPGIQGSFQGIIDRVAGVLNGMDVSTDAGGITTAVPTPTP